MQDRSLSDWDQHFKLVQDLDPYDHLRSIHNCRGFYDHGKPWVTHCSIQHHNLFKMSTWLAQYQKPVVVDECGYEGDIWKGWGSLSAEELLVRFWLGFAAGGYVGHGETYWNEDEVLWWSKGGVLHGDSAPRIAFLRAIIEAVPAPGLSPFMDDRAKRAVIPGGEVIGSHLDDRLYLAYFAMHQPRFWDFELAEGRHTVDIIDTWNMTIDSVEHTVSGTLRVELPCKKYMAVRITRSD
jgi:hypothetical protein